MSNTHISAPCLIVGEHNEAVELFFVLFGPNHWKGAIGAAKGQSTGVFDHFSDCGFLGEWQWGQLAFESDAFDLGNMR